MNQYLPLVSADLEEECEARKKERGLELVSDLSFSKYYGKTCPNSTVIY